MEPNAVTKMLNITTNDTTVTPSLIQCANKEIARLFCEEKITKNSVASLQAILRENATLMSKTHKLKSLLSRASTASRDQQIKLNTRKQLLSSARHEIEVLHSKVQHLNKRTTHMDILTDFETNFDRALLSLNIQHVVDDGQSGEEDPSSAVARMNNIEKGEARKEDRNGVGSELARFSMELDKTKCRVEQLESLNSSLMGRAFKLESENAKLVLERESEKMKLNNMQLDIRMARMETENAIRAMKEKAASLAEMQLEIDLVTMSTIDANRHAVVGKQATRFRKTEQAYVNELEVRAMALEEWAVASSTAKDLLNEHSRILEKNFDEMIGRISNETEQDKKHILKLGSCLVEEIPIDDEKNASGSMVETRLWTKNSTLVIGAGTIQTILAGLEDYELGENKTVLLRWKFDVIPNNMDIVFSILKGECHENRQIRNAEAMIRNIHVMGGGGGELKGAFDGHNSCTLMWSNEHSWVRPISIKYVLEAYAVI